MQFSHYNCMISGRHYRLYVKEQVYKIVFMVLQQAKYLLYLRAKIMSMWPTTVHYLWQQYTRDVLSIHLKEKKKSKGLDSSVKTENSSVKIKQHGHPTLNLVWPAQTKKNGIQGRGCKDFQWNYNCVAVHVQCRINEYMVLR